MAISQPAYPITTADLVTHVGAYADTKGGAAGQSTITFQPFGEPATLGVTGSVRMWMSYATITGASMRVLGGPSGGAATAEVRRNGKVVTTLSIASGSTAEVVTSLSQISAAGDHWDLNVTAVNGATGIMVQVDLQPAVAPADPSTVASMKAWWDADDLGADASAVTSWTGRIASRSLAQATAGNQPVVRANAINGHKAVEFGVDDFLSYTAGAAFLTSATMDCWVVVRRAGGGSVGSNPIVLSVDAGANDWDNIASAEVITYGNSSQQMYSFRNNVTGSPIDWPVPRDTYGIVHSWWDGTNHRMEEVGSQLGPNVAQTGAFAASRVWVGAYQGTSNFFTGRIAAILLADGATAGHRSTVNNYLQARYGL
jgi:hypothetical protein